MCRKFILLDVRIIRKLIIQNEFHHRNELKAWITRSIIPKWKHSGASLSLAAIKAVSDRRSVLVTWPKFAYLFITTHYFYYGGSFFFFFFFLFSFSFSLLFFTENINGRYIIYSIVNCVFLILKIPHSGMRTRCLPNHNHHSFVR